MNNDREHPVLQVVNMSKSYGRIAALIDANIRLMKGEIVGLIGDNGAGKSTLIRCISGAERPDNGEMYLDGQLVSFREPLEAMQAGIQIVYQSLAVCPAQDIATNVFLGREIRLPGLMGKVFRTLDTRKMRALAEGHIKTLGIETLQDITQPVETLSGGQRQAVAVARAAAFGTKVVILDEPTAALGVRESAQVVKLMERIREQGMPVLLIAHDIPMVSDIADRILIMRHGRFTAELASGESSVEDLIAMMTGAKTI